MACLRFKEVMKPSLRSGLGKLKAQVARCLSTLLLENVVEGLEWIIHRTAYWPVTLQRWGRLLLQYFLRYLISSGRGSFLKFYFLRVPLHYSRILIPFFCTASDSVLVWNTGSPHRLIRYKLLFKDPMRELHGKMQVFFEKWIWE